MQPRGQHHFPAAVPLPHRHVAVVEVVRHVTKVELEDECPQVITEPLNGLVFR